MEHESQETMMWHQDLNGNERRHPLNENLVIDARDFLLLKCKKNEIKMKYQMDQSNDDVLIKNKDSKKRHDYMYD
jgi:hypothetical protein